MLTLVLGISLIIITIVLVSVFFVFMIRSVFLPSKQAPYINSFQKDLNVLKHLKIPKGSKVIDLGCGDAKALRFFNKHFEISDAVGYDINPYPILIGKIINTIKKQKNIKLYRQNFLKVSIKNYEYIYLYLLPRQLANIEGWIRKNKNKQAIIISNSFQFQQHSAFQIIKNKKGKNVLFLYK